VLALNRQQLYEDSTPVIKYAAMASEGAAALDDSNAVFAESTAKSAGFAALAVISTVIVRA
jgi:hypothetical protein